MAIAYSSGPEPPLAEINTVTTQTAQSVPPTAPSAKTVTTVTDCLDRGRQLRPTSPAFMMNAIPDNRPGPTTNPLLLVNTGQDGNTNSFITPTLVTSHQNCQGNRNTVMFKNTIPETDKQINARLIEIANQGPTLETTVTSHPDHPIPDRRQYTNHGEHQYQSMYTNQNRSYNSNYNRNYRQTWENHTARTCNNCGTKGHIAKYVPKLHCGASGAVRLPMTPKLADPNPDPVHPWNHQAQVVTTQPNHQPNTILQTTNQHLHIQHIRPQHHQAERNGLNFW